jgi:hypothetical protein
MCLSSLVTAEPVSVDIPFDLLKKKRAMTQKTNVSIGKTDMDKLVRRRELPCVRRLRSLHRMRVVRGMMPRSMKKKK